MGRSSRPGPQPISRARRGSGGCAWGKPLQFRFEFTNNIRGGGEKLVVILIPASEGYKVVGILARTLVPFCAHALVNFHTSIVAYLAI